MDWFPRDKTVLEIAYLCANVALAFISLVAIGVAGWTITENRKIQREQTARNAYIRYIELAFHHPEFAAPDWENIHFDEESYGPPNVPDRKERFERYCWFVSIMMHTVDFVFTTVPRDRVLQKLMILQISYHWKYIEHFKSKEKYLKYRYSQHKKKIKKGIRLGRELEERRELEKKERLKEKGYPKELA